MLIGCRLALSIWLVAGTGWSQNWSDPTSWDGAPPEAGTAVSIPAGKRIVLDQDIDVASLTIAGELVCAAQDLAVRAGFVMVHAGGRLVCGTVAEPFTNRLRITLTGGATEANEMGMGAKFLGAMSGGVIELHGETRRSWLRLARNGRAGDAELLLEAAPNWRAGDRVVIASTDYYWDQAEERTVAGMAGEKVTLDEPLSFLHWGTLQVFPHQNLSGLTMLDERAEVGLLSRNIVIEGDELSGVAGFGGHIMAMSGAKLYLSGVELNRMGQRGRLARYPVHWHMMGSVEGQYVEQSSIHHSYNRCVTVHASHQAVVKDNVCFDHIGHGFFLEDGVEEGNNFTGNLGLVSRRPRTGQQLLASDISFNGPATFWISNPNNEFRGNVAAGSEGSAFWYMPLSRAVGETWKIPAFRALYQEIAPFRRRFGEFNGNVAHSSRTGLFVSGQGGQDEAGSVGTNEEFFHSFNLPVFENFTGYKITGDTGGQSGVVWIRARLDASVRKGDLTLSDAIFRNFTVADFRHGYNFTYRQILDGGLIVAESANVGTPRSSQEKAYGRTLPLRQIRDDMPQTGFGFYDGPHRMRQVHFAGFVPKSPGPLFAAFEEVQGAYTAYDNSTEGITYEPGSALFLWKDRDAATVNPQPTASEDRARPSGLLDLDGSLTGRPGSTVFENGPLLGENCVEVQNVTFAPISGQLGSGSRHGRPITAQSCQVEAAAFYWRPDAPTSNQNSVAPILMTRDDGAKAYAEGHCRCIDQVHFAQANVATRRTYTLDYNAGKTPRSFTLELGPAPVVSWIDARVPTPPGDFSVYQRTGAQWLRVTPGEEQGYLKVRVTQGQTVLVCRTAGLCR